MDTSGLILLARTKAAQRALSAEFAARRVRKTYHAVIMGAPREESGVIDLPLRADWPNRPKQMVCREAGKTAITEWVVETRLGSRSLIRLHPLTGRSHQLRVHMAAMGWPILGDPFYAPAEAAAPRLMLHASHVTWRMGGRAASAAAPHPFQAAASGFF